jgi:hypothetical protein
MSWSLGGVIREQRLTPAEMAYVINDAGWIRWRGRTTRWRV